MQISRMVNVLLMSVVNVGYTSAVNIGVYISGKYGAYVNSENGANGSGIVKFPSAINMESISVGNMWSMLA